MSQTYKTKRLEVQTAMDNPQERPRPFFRVWNPQRLDVGQDNKIQALLNRDVLTTTN